MHKYKFNLADPNHQRLVVEIDSESISFFTSNGSGDYITLTPTEALQFAGALNYGVHRLWDGAAADSVGDIHLNL